jgi:predicted phage terminase large subunit-like protein
MSRNTTSNSRISDKEWQAYLDLSHRISEQTEVYKDETEQERLKRVESLLKVANFEAFCKYYFPHYIDCDFGWFHKKAAKEILKSNNCFAVLEWAREHAKSVFADVFIPIWLLAKGELSGMILASETDPKAKVLISDIEAELRKNKRYIADFGDQHILGSWANGHFMTSGGIGFWSFGIGQNPAGVRKAAKRPNYGVVDDASSKKKAKNQVIVKQDLDWILGEFMGCLAIKGKRFVFANNRTAKNDLTAHMVGDIEEGDKKREGIIHIKVYATEDPKTHQMLEIASGGVPAWRERYTVDHIATRMHEMGYRNGMRQMYHKHIEDGNIFLPEQLPWGKCPSLEECEALISYNDPSFKDTKKNDFKAIVLIGKIGRYYYVLWAWVRQASKAAMVSAHYDLDEIIKAKQRVVEIDNAKLTEILCRHYMEANFMQDLLLEEYELEGDSRGYQMRIRPDNRSKPDKTGRIEDLSTIAERGYLIFNEQYRKNPDMITLRDQFLAFPSGHDDGPDACEGAIYLLNKQNKTGKDKPYRSGTFTKTNRRAA